MPSVSPFAHRTRVFRWALLAVVVATLGGLGIWGFRASASVPREGLKLWLRADEGVTLVGGKVSLWTDQSGSGTNALQPAEASRPVVRNKIINGLPAVEFDGADDFLAFNLPVNDLTGMTMVLAAAAASPVQDGSWHGATHSALFWNETSDWSTVVLSPYQKAVKYRFGTGQANNIPVYSRPAPVGPNFTVTMAMKHGPSEKLFVNGALVAKADGKLPKLVDVRSTGNLGRGYNDNTYFAGRIAEVLIYTRALADSERKALDDYLLDRYPPSAVPENQAPLVAAGAGQTITAVQGATLRGTATDDQLPNGTLKVTWSMVRGPGVVSFANAQAAATTATFSEPGTYMLRLTAEDGAAASSDNVIITVEPSALGSLPIRRVEVRQEPTLWLRADKGVVQNGGKVSRWDDQSGSGTHAVQPVAASQPTLKTGAANGRPALEFDGIDDFLTFEMPLNGGGEMSMMLVSAANSPSQDGGWHGATHAALFWNESSDWSTVVLSPFQSVVKYRFGTGQPKNLPSFKRPSPIGSSFTLTTAIKDGATEKLFVNCALVATERGKLTQMKGARTTGNLGRGYNDNTFFAGRIAEVIIYSRALSDSERQEREAELKAKYLGGS